MLTCFIRYEIDPFKKEAFAEYARTWGQAIPQNGADLIGYFAPHEGSLTTAYGVKISRVAHETCLAERPSSPPAAAGETLNTENRNAAAVRCNGWLCCATSG